MTRELLDNISPAFKGVFDGTAIAMALLTFLNTLLPAIASLLSIVWLGVRIYDYFKYSRKPKDE